MALVASLNILGVVMVVTLAAKTTFAESSNCGHFNLTASLDESTITSPNYPLDYYDNLNCTWLLKVSFSGRYIVKVTFNDFLLEEGHPCDDVLKFYDGMNEKSSLLGSYCGTTHPEVIYSTGQYLYVKFHTDNIINYKGFNFSFTAVKKEEASGICRLSNGSDKINKLGGFSGTFFTPDYPVPYPDDASCNWIISVPSGKRVKLRFEDFDFKTVSSSCKQRTNEKDYVQIGSGQVPGSNALALYCGYGVASPLNVYSTGRYMWVKFYSISSNRSQSSKGFKAHFEAVDLQTVEKEHKGTVEKKPKGPTFMGIAIVSAVRSVLFIFVAALAAILFKTHRAGRNPNIPDGANVEEITPYATVRILLNAENYDIPLKTLPFQLTVPTEERAAGRTELRNSPYQNIDHLGRSMVTPLEYLFYQPRYENEAVDNETRSGAMIRPGYDKLTLATRKKRRENGGAHLGQRLPCGMVDTHCLSEYDSLIWETDLRCKSRRGDITDSESEDNMNIYTILGVPSCDEGSPSCSMDRRRNQGNSLGDTQFGCIENDWKTSDV